jgi:hypothetical protein
MDAYYYGFERTGVGFIDAILSAVAIAGKGAHHTESWGAPWEGTTDYFHGHPGLPDAEDAVDLIQKAAQQAADAVLALFPHSTRIAEPTAQVPVSLIERAKNALLEVPPSSRNADIYGELHTLLSQPSPSALPHFCTPGCTNENCPVKPLTDAEAAELRAVLSDRGLAMPVGPPSIADMVPGTTFTAQQWGGATHFPLKAISAERFEVQDDAGGWLSVEDVDPSTIRDVTPPPATPEDGDHG